MGFGIDFFEEGSVVLGGRVSLLEMGFQEESQGWAVLQK